MARSVTPLSADETQQMVTAVRRLVGVPFKHRGRDERGIDCIGLVRHGLLAVGREVGDYRLYGRDPEPDGQRLRGVLQDHFGDPVTDMRVGDVVLMRWHFLPNHMAVVGDYLYGGLSLIHALRHEGAVKEHRLAGPWPDRIVEVYRPGDVS
jgi:cell wall-associated NlpC family hydrolase